MPIRREDKEFIQSIALIGALFGAFVGVIVTIHLSDRAHEQDSLQAEYHQTHAAITKLSTAGTVLDLQKPVVDQDVLKQVKEQIQYEQPAYLGTEKSFWLRIPRWGFFGICAGSCVAGAGAGFAAIWATGWISSAITFSLIRLMYRIIRKCSPNSKAAQRILAQSNTNIQNQMAFQRDNTRVLPILVKLLLFFLLALCILLTVVWHLTSI